MKSAKRGKHRCRLIMGRSGAQFRVQRRNPARFNRAFYGCILYKVGNANGPVAQGIEQQPSKLKVAGSNPAGVATTLFYSFSFNKLHLG